MVKISKGGATVAKTIKGGEGGSSISKQVGWINKNAWLNGSITYTEVIEPLSMIDEAHALNLLEELTFKAPTIKDPTKWLISAAKRASEGDAKPFFKGGKSGGKGTGSKVGKTIGWMNRHGELQQPIRFDEVGPLLMVLGDGLAGKLLKELDDAKETIKNPTAWLASAARRAGTGGMGGMMMDPSAMMMGGKGGMMMDPSAMMMGGGMGMPGSSKKLSKTIGWLNKNSAKENPIMFNEVIGPLMAMGEGAACKLLNEFDEKAGEIKDPTKWLTAAAMRKTRW